MCDDGGIKSEDVTGFLFGPGGCVQDTRELEIPLATPLSRDLARALDDIEAMMLERHKKYGTGNIAKHGPLGIQVRMDDKFARLEAGSENYDDETVENTLDDIIGYALIWKLWLRGEWPGSPYSRRSAS